MDPLTGLVLRPITMEDLDAVRELHIRSWEVLAAAAHTPGQLAAHTAIMRDPAYRDELLANNLVLAEAPDGALLGTAGWRPHDGKPGMARVRKVFVDPTVAGSGLGRRLVLDAEARAAQAGYGSYFVRSQINAVGFYGRLGYREIEPGEIPFPGGNAIPIMFMEKREH